MIVDGGNTQDVVVLYEIDFCVGIVVDVAAVAVVVGGDKVVVGDKVHCNVVVVDYCWYCIGGLDYPRHIGGSIGCGSSWDKKS